MKRNIHYLSLVFIIIIMSCTNKNQSGIIIEYYKNGNINTLNHKLSEDADLLITFNKNEDLESIGYSMDSLPIGFFSLYTKGNLYHQRQYLKINGKSYINQYWNYDENGNIDRGMSNYFSLKTSGDTVKLYKEWTLDIFLDCPYFGGAMKVYLGNFDDNYNLIDSTSLEVLDGKNNRVIKSYTFSTTGEKIITGIIYDFDKSYSDTIMSQQIRKLYFKKRVIVVD